MKHKKTLPLQIMAVADLHMLSAALNDKGEMLRRISQTGDGKVLPYSAEIVEAFVRQVLTDAPDYLIISGDLSYNGERQSHLDLIELLDRIEQAGIQVFVIPGNHDIDTRFASAFSENQAFQTETVTYEEFYQLYKKFGYEDARLRDPASFSYAAQLSDEVWLLMIDVNTKDHPGRVSPQTLAWLKTALAEARAQGKTVLTSTHQNILAHNEMFTAGFVIENHSQLQALLKDHQVLLNLSGHIHMQHLMLDQTGLSEAATGALASSPHPIAYIRIDEALRLHYQINPVDVSAWARTQSVRDENLLDFAGFSQQYFYGITAAKIGAELLQDAGIDEADVIRMTEFSARVHTAYFSGELHDLLADPKTHPDYQLWEEKGQGMRFWYYLNSFLLQPLKDETSFSLSLLPDTASAGNPRDALK